MLSNRGPPFWRPSAPISGVCATDCRLPCPASCDTACIPRAPGGPVDLDRYAARGSPRFHQLERPVWTTVSEQPRALADNHGKDEQVHLVDKLVVEQPA